MKYKKLYGGIEARKDYCVEKLQTLWEEKQ
jgi:hypothetical protein